MGKKEDNSDQRTDNRKRISLEGHFTMRFGWARGKRKDNAEPRSAQRFRREEEERISTQSTQRGHGELREE